MNTHPNTRTRHPMPAWLSTLVWVTVAGLVTLGLAIAFHKVPNETAQAAGPWLGGFAGAVGMLLLSLAALGFYGLPAVIAHWRGHRNFTALLVANLLLGWTFIGWVACLIWALLDSERDRR